MAIRLTPLQAAALQEAGYHFSQKGVAFLPGARRESYGSNAYLGEDSEAEACYSSTRNGARARYWRESVACLEAEQLADDAAAGVEAPPWLASLRRICISHGSDWIWQAAGAGIKVMHGRGGMAEAATAAMSLPDWQAVFEMSVSYGSSWRIVPVRKPALAAVSVLDCGMPEGIVPADSGRKMSERFRSAAEQAGKRIAGAVVGGKVTGRTPLKIALPGFAPSRGSVPGVASWVTHDVSDGGQGGGTAIVWWADGTASLLRDSLSTLESTVESMEQTLRSNCGLQMIHTMFQDAPYIRDSLGRMRAIGKKELAHTFAEDASDP
jgi:hypothetical protein